MSVSSIGAAGASVTEHAKNTAPQRSAGPATPAEQAAEIASKVKSDMPAPTSHANRVGVAAYLSIMNPAPAISMRTEA